MTLRLTLPVGMRFNDWADQILQDLEIEGLSPINVGEKEWQKWALAVCQIPLIASRNPPNPLHNNNWQEWADHFIRSVY